MIRLMMRVGAGGLCGCRIVRSRCKKVDLKAIWDDWLLLLVRRTCPANFRAEGFRSNAPSGCLAHRPPIWLRGREGFRAQTNTEMTVRVISATTKVIRPAQGTCPHRPLAEQNGIGGVAHPHPTFLARTRRERVRVLLRQSPACRFLTQYLRLARVSDSPFGAPAPPFLKHSD